MNKFRLEVRSRVLTARAAGPSMAPRWDCLGRVLKLGWRQSQGVDGCHRDHSSWAQGCSQLRVPFLLCAHPMPLTP